jgi:glutathione S-transferase
MSLILYYAPGSCAFASMISLEETGATYKNTLVDLSKGAQKSSEFVAINPHARVPVLVCGTTVITENIAVLTYIATKFPSAHLLPQDDPLALARAYSLLSWFSTGPHIEIAKIFRGERFTSDEHAKSQIKLSGMENFGKNLAEVEELARRPGAWLCGDHFTVVDAFGLVLWRWAKRLEFDTDRFPAWSEQVARAHGRPAVRRAIARETPA